MDLKYIKCKNERTPDVLISIDIGYASTGVCIYDFNTEEVRFLSPNIKKYLEGTNTKNLGIIDYLYLSKKVRSFVLMEIMNNFVCRGKSLSFSLEIPNIVGCYAPALALLINAYTDVICKSDRVHKLYFTHNRLGSFYLKKRGSTKNEIKQMISKAYPDLKPNNQHERDALLQCHTVLALEYNILLSNYMRSLKDSTVSKVQR